MTLDLNLRVILEGFSFIIIIFILKILIIIQYENEIECMFWKYFKFGKSDLEYIITFHPIIDSKMLK